MRIFNFAVRNFKEIIRDPLSLVFAICLPLVLLIVFQQINIPSDSYNIENFTPGIIVFSFSFITLFTATLVAKDKSTQLLTRLMVSPMKPYEYVLGYILALIPVVFMQSILFYICALIFKLKFNIGIIFAILISIVISILFIVIGIFIGSLVNEKAASGVSSIIIQLVAFTSGMYFDSSMLGDGFNLVCEVLPFKHTLNIIKGFQNLNFNEMLVSFIIFFIYLLISIVITSIVFKKKSS